MSCLSSLDTFWHEPEWRRTENRALPDVVGKPHPGGASARRPSSSCVPALLSSRAHQTAIGRPDLASGGLVRRSGWRDYQMTKPMANTHMPVLTNWANVD